MALDENQNEIFDRNERILAGCIVFIEKDINNRRVDVPGLVHRIDLRALQNQVTGKQRKSFFLRNEQCTIIID